MKLKHLTGPSRAYGHMADLHTKDMLFLLHGRFMDQQRANVPPGYIYPDSGKPFVCWDEPGEFHVYVNHGRTMVNCSCYNGVIVDVDWMAGACFACGRQFTAEHLIIPQNMEEIDEVLGPRHPHQRNFDPRIESFEDLKKGIV